MRHRDRSGAQPLWRRYRRFFGPDVAGDVDEELQFHLEMLMDENLARGMTPDEARRAAERRFGDRTRVEAECREVGERRERAIRRAEWLDALWADLRFALRQLRANRALTLIAVATLALGIGANTAIFSVVHSVLLRPLPYDDADRVVVLWETWRGDTGGVSAGHFADWRERTTSYEAMAAFDGGTFNLAPAGGEPERVYGGRVTPSFFQVASVRPLLGRWLLEGEDRPGRDRVVVLSHPLWQRMGADPRIVGQSIPLNGEPHTVVGVAPKEYTLTEQDEALWVPLGFTPQKRADYDSHPLIVLAKLKPGVPRERAEAELVRVTRRINHEEHPELPILRERGASIQDLRDVLVGGYRTQLLVLLTSVGFVLLLAVVNVANLLLARARVRQKEISIRAALGAGRGRIVRQLLTESVVLSLAGGLAAMAVAWLGIRFLVKMGPPGVPRLGEAELSLPVLAFALAATVGSGLLFGLAPALRVARTDLQSTLREGGRSGSMGSARDRLRGVLVVGELALALVLLVGAGLLIRSGFVLNQVRPGFDPEGVLTARVSLPAGRYPDAERVTAAFGRMVEELRTTPGVQAAAAANAVPMVNGSANVGLQVEGRTFTPAEQPQVDMRVVTPGYLEALRIPVKEGRALGPRDDATAPHVVVINETLARQLWPGESALGKRVGGGGAGWREVVGVVGAVRHRGLAQDAAPEVYIPMLQAPGEVWEWFDRSMTLVVRGADAAALAPVVRRTVRAGDPTLPVFDVRPLAESMALTQSGSRFNTLLLTALAVTGLVLALVGIYGVISYFVSQRTHEIGVRLALGATARDVVRLVVREGVVIGAIGVGIGLLAALGATRVLQALLFGVSTTDPLVLVGSGAVLFGAALLASYLPARRAARVEPLISLR
jgi:predicted permease